MMPGNIVCVKHIRYTQDALSNECLVIIREIVYAVWYPYKHVCNVIFCKFFPMFTYIMAPAFEASVCIYMICHQLSFSSQWAHRESRGCA